MAGTSADKLKKLKQTKADIKAAIQEKGQAVSDADTFASYADKIRAIDNDVVLQEKTATANGEVTPDAGFGGLSKVTVNVPSPEGTREITENGVFDVEEYEKVEVHVPQPSGTTIITENGTHDVNDYSAAVVNVPVPDGYIQPSGDLEITENGTKDVTNYASVTVNVPSGGTGGECDKNHIIEVDELPTENIDENALYKVGDSYYKYANEFKDALMFLDGTVISFTEIIQSEGGTLEFFYVDNYENVTDIHPFDEATMTIPAYYDESRDDVFIYMDGAWVSYSQLEGAINGGAITDTSEATEDGYYYALVDNGWKLYGNPSIIEVNKLPEVGEEGVVYSVPQVNAIAIVINGVGVIAGLNCCTVQNRPEIGFEHIAYIVENDGKVYQYSYSNGWTVLCSVSNRISNINNVSGLAGGYYVLINPVLYQFVSGQYRQVVVKKNVFKFTSNGDGTCSVSGIDPYSNDLDVIIPSTSPSGESVTSLDVNAFGVNMYMLRIENIIIPDSVISIPKFKELSELKTVVLGNSLTSIAERGFKDCTSLKTVVIGRVVTSIGDEAFSGCINLKNIIFKGTTAQWGYVSLGNNWNKDVPATEITCNDGTVSL